MTLTIMIVLLALILWTMIPTPSSEQEPVRKKH